MNQIIFWISFFLIYYNISGLATTNILRLTKGNELPVLASECRCGNCGAKISPFLQLPIISYIICKGRCRSCKTKIPVDALIMEIVLVSVMMTVSILYSFSYMGVSLSFLFYEAVRVVVILKKGRRADSFYKQYLIAVLAMIPFYLITLFVSALHTSVCGG